MLSAVLELLILLTLPLQHGTVRFDRSLCCLPVEFWVSISLPVHCTLRIRYTLLVFIVMVGVAGGFFNCVLPTG